MLSESVRHLGMIGVGQWSDAEISHAKSAKRLGDQLSGRIAELIERGEFPESRRLPSESELADRFGVSRPVVREALSRLRVMGVISSRKGSGSYVEKRDAGPPPPRPAASFGPVDSLAQVKKCFEFRGTVESEAAYYAALNRSAEDIRAMREALAGIETAIASGAVGANPDCEFHLAVAGASGNEFFATVMLMMRTPIEFAIDLARSLSLTRPFEHLLTIQAEHVAIFEAIERHDAEMARSAMRAHVENSCSRVFDGPSRVPAPPQRERDAEPAGGRPI
jgi:DNA-binding FadR family transcriptional regulator